MQVGKAYHVMGKLPGMSRFMLLGDGELVNRVLYALIVEIDTPEKLERVKGQIEALKRDNPGSEWKTRPVKGWTVRYLPVAHTELEG